MGPRGTSLLLFHPFEELIGLQLAKPGIAARELENIDLEPLGNLLQLGIPGLLQLLSRRVRYGFSRSHPQDEKESQDRNPKYKSPH